MNTRKNVKINYAFAFFTNIIVFWVRAKFKSNNFYFNFKFNQLLQLSSMENFHKFTNQKPLHKCFLMLSSLSYFEAMLNVLRVEENSRLVLKLITHHSISYTYLVCCLIMHRGKRL
jgi:hypothetical protein